ncbi:3-hxdroxyacyl-CoA dehydrogenase [Longibacter salinarum]|uniref:3-hxdroxyacyl-CoA dehydrogenase n=1 Tax=Longibacter salinarum TaxID=1850348 RepID=A0A2A8CYH4_9BACT|nr:enoyl-CoA hydratase-related protein [Longibacter salinarum]PEN13653.1 3-hxdroxyacyl-CoA dehydrogenase [Longibacter salinarum]
MPDVLYETRDAVATITLNRPDARNAYSDEMVKELLAAIDEADADDSVHSVVITGAGPVFSAGGDLKAMRDREGMFAGDPAELRNQYRKGLQQLPRRFDQLEKPVVAAVHGAAIGAGLDLALMADLRIASDDAKFGSTFARVGLVPGDGGAYLLTRVIGFARALDLVLTARIVEAQEALDMGLVTSLAPSEQVVDVAHERAEQIASLPPKAVQAAKACLYRSVDNDLETALQLTAALQATVQHTDDHDEAVRSMIDRLQNR